METIQKTFNEMCTEVLQEQNNEDNLDNFYQSLQQAKWEYNTELKELKHNFSK